MLTDPNHFQKNMVLIQRMESFLVSLKKLRSRLWLFQKMYFLNQTLPFWKGKLILTHGFGTGVNINPNSEIKIVQARILNNYRIVCIQNDIQLARNFSYI